MKIIRSIYVGTIFKKNDKHKKERMFYIRKEKYDAGYYQDAHLHLKSKICWLPFGLYSLQ